VLPLLVNVAAGRKRPARASEDDAADFVIRFDAFQELLDFKHHCSVHRIELVWPVQCDSQDAVFGLGEDGLVCHRILLRHFEDRSRE
jgi:hypothetical protein